MLNNRFISNLPQVKFLKNRSIFEVTAKGEMLLFDLYDVCSCIYARNIFQIFKFRSRYLRRGNYSDCRLMFTAYC